MVADLLFAPVHQQSRSAFALAADRPGAPGRDVAASAARLWHLESQLQAGHRGCDSAFHPGDDQDAFVPGVSLARNDVVAAKRRIRSCSSQSTADIAVWAPIGLSAAVWWLARFNGSPGLERCRAMLLATAAVTALVAIAGHVVETGSERPGAFGRDRGRLRRDILIALAIARQGQRCNPIPPPVAEHGPRCQPSRSWRLRHLLSLLVTVRQVSQHVGIAVVSRHRARTILPAAGAAADRAVHRHFAADRLASVAGQLSTASASVPEFGATGENEPARSALDWQPPDPLRYLLAALVLVAIFYGLTRFGLALTRRDFDPLETGDRELSAPARDSATGWTGSAGGSDGTIARDPLAGLRNDPAWAHTVTIRDTYADWLRFAEQRKLGARHRTKPPMSSTIAAGPNLQSSSACRRARRAHRDLRRRTLCRSTGHTRASRRARARVELT